MPTASAERMQACGLQQESKSWGKCCKWSREKGQEANDLVALPVNVEMAHLDTARGERVVTHLWNPAGQHIHQ